MSKNAFMRQSPVRRSSALLSVAALATTALIATAGPAGAALFESQEEHESGAAAYFHDDAGLAVQLCLEACVEEAEEGEPAPEPADPAHAPYFAAAADVSGVSVGWGLESIAVENEEDPTAPAEMGVENGVRIDARPGVLTGGATYRLDGPWGAIRFVAEADGGADHRAASGGEEGSPLTGPVQTFLRPVGLSGEMLGDAHTFTRVTGSPTGFNRVTITGPGFNESTNVFALTGQLQGEQAMTDVSAKSLDMGTSAAAVTQQITYTNYGTGDATPTVAISGANAGRFSVSQTATTVAPNGGTSIISVTYDPQPNRAHSAILTVSDNSLAAPRQVALSGQGVDTLLPRLSSRTPAPGSSVGRAKNVKVGFSEAVRGVSRRTFTLVETRTGDKVRATVRRVRQSNSYVLNPRRALDRRTRYTVRLDGGSAGIRDLSGNAARDSSWKFTTR